MELLEPLKLLQYVLDTTRLMLNYDNMPDQDIENENEKERQDRIAEIYKEISNQCDDFLLPGVKSTLLVYIYSRWFPIEFDLIDNDIFTSKVSYYTWNLDT